MSVSFIGKSLVLCFLSISVLALSEHTPSENSTGASGSTNRTAGPSRPMSSTLRTALLSCADKLGTLQPSKDYANFMIDKKGMPYVFLFHQSGTYIVPLNGEKLKNGSYQALVSFPTNPERKEKILLTISGTTVRTSVPIVTDQTPQVPNTLNDTLNALSSIANGEEAKDSETEHHFLSERFTPNVAADVQSRATNVVTKLPKIENIFNDVNFALELQKAQEAATKATTKDTTAAQFEADLKKRFAAVYNKFDKEGRFKVETQKAMDTLAKEMADMMEALKECASNPAVQVSKTAKSLLPKMRLANDAHQMLQTTFSAYIANRLAGMNTKNYDTIDGETLKTIHDSIAQGIQEAYTKARKLNQEGLQKKQTGFAQNSP